MFELLLGISNKVQSIIYATKNIRLFSMRYLILFIKKNKTVK